METIIKLKNGVEISLPSAQEAAIFVRETGLIPSDKARPEQLAIANVAPSKPPAKPRVNGDATPFDPDAGRMALELLSLIESEPQGVGYERVMNALKANTPKGIGNRAAMVNKQLEALGFQRYSFYRNPKGPNGRVWQAGKQIREAINALEERVGR